MSNPWDRPSLPSLGDANPNLTYAGVGRVLSQWEHVELQLGFLHSAILGKFQNWDAVLEYGLGSTSNVRITNLQTKAETQFFVKYPNQQIEGELDCLCKKVGAFAARRHDIAHSILRNEEWALWRIPGQPHPNAQGRRYFLLPSDYRGKSFDPMMLPAYAYTAATLRDVEKHLAHLATEVMGFGNTIAKFASSKP